MLKHVHVQHTGKMQEKYALDAAKTAKNTTHKKPAKPGMPKHTRQ